MTPRRPRRSRAPARASSSSTASPSAPADDRDVEASEDDGAQDLSDTTPLRVPPEQLRSDDKLVSLLRRAVESAADESGWARVGTVGNHISNQSSFDPRNYGYAKLSRLLEASGLFDVRDEGLTTVAVRDKKIPGARGPAGRRASRRRAAAERVDRRGHASHGRAEERPGTPGGRPPPRDDGHGRGRPEDHEEDEPWGSRSMTCTMGAPDNGAERGSESP